MNDRVPVSIQLSLISHTNAGKTTLARTLLGQDVGEVRDAPHVTDFATAYTLFKTDQGDALELWDTPGFGDTARLLKRLRQAGNPLGWLLSQVWDRWRERPLWCSQQAVQNAREQADLVLYLVNAGEDPADASFVALEMEILEWIGKPVIVLLNQMGPPRNDGVPERELWRKHLQGFGVVREVLALDAFARCWVQEEVLLRHLEKWLPGVKQPAFAALAGLWRERNRRRYAGSMQVLARQLAKACSDREALAQHTWPQRMVARLGNSQQREQKRAMQALAERLDQDIVDATRQLIALHDLQGEAVTEVLRRLREDYATEAPIEEGFAAVVGGLVSGALGGLAADLAAGGLTFGGGMVAGSILGALGASGAAHALNRIRGEHEEQVRWSEQFVTALVRSAVLRYLAVAHFGRGRGDYTQSEHPAFWQELVAAEVAAEQTAIHAVWEQGKASVGPTALEPAWETLLTRICDRLLARLYPDAARIVSGAQAPAPTMAAPE